MRVDNGLRHVLTRQSVEVHFDQSLFSESHATAQDGTFDSHQNVGHGCDCKPRMDEIASRSSFRWLAFRTKMRGAAAEHEALNRSAANDARLAGAVVNPVNFLKIAWLAIGVAIIP